MELFTKEELICVGVPIVVVGPLSAELAPVVGLIMLEGV